jgi:hypothetical protein
MSNCNCPTPACPSPNQTAYAALKAFVCRKISELNDKIDACCEGNAAVSTLVYDPATGIYTFNNGAGQITLIDANASAIRMIDTNGFLGGALGAITNVQTFLDALLLSTVGVRTLYYDIPNASTDRLTIDVTTIPGWEAGIAMDNCVGIFLIVPDITVDQVFPLHSIAAWTGNTITLDLSGTIPAPTGARVQLRFVKPLY